MGLKSLLLIASIFYTSASASADAGSGSRNGSGNKTEPLEFPYLIALFRLDTPNSEANDTTPVEFVCGGSVVTYNWIMTAAHCLNVEKRPEFYRVEAGSYNLSDYTELAHVTGIDRIVFHPNYKRGKLAQGHNIALARVRDSFIFSQRLKPAYLPNPAYDYKVDKVVTVGRGLPLKNDRLLRVKHSDVPLKSEFTVLSSNSCKSAMDSNNPENVSDTIFCARTKNESDQNVYLGDLGGLAIYYISIGLPVQMGIIGLSTDSNKREKLAVQSGTYSRADSPAVPFSATYLPKLVDWIKEITDEK